MDQALTYDLAFRVGQRRPRTPPEIIFIIAEHHLPKVSEKLQQLIEGENDNIQAYLEDDTSTFSFPYPDLFGKRSFGYSNCGYVTIEAEKAYFRLPLRPDPWTYRTSLSISLLIKALQSFFTEDQWSGSKQDTILLLLCDRNRAGGHGHSVGGWVSQRVMAWLKNYVKDTSSNLDFNDRVPIHPAVIQAQQATWYAINPPDMQRYGSPWEIRSHVYENGAFILTCSGNACDLGVYPSDYSGRESELISLNCHNLDTDCQQLTLFAGLAKICELARSS